MALACSLTASLALWAALSQPAVAQAGPNTLAQYNPSNRTFSTNSTICILPITKAAAQTISGYAPLDIPSSILPNFPAGMHPLLVQSGYDNDIRMTPYNTVPLQIAALMEGFIFIPSLDVTKDGKTAITVPINSYIGGTNGEDTEALVPSIASTISPFEGTTVFPATFAPDTEADMYEGDGVYSIEVKPFLLPNTVSGPGVYAEAFDILFQITQKSPYTATTFHSLVNQPRLLNNGECQLNTIYYNQTFTNPQMAVANVTVYHEILDSPPAGLEGTYTDVYCYQANGEEVASLPESCPAAAANNPPSASQ